MSMLANCKNRLQLKSFFIKGFHEIQIISFRPFKDNAHRMYFTIGIIKSWIPITKALENVFSRLCLLDNHLITDFDD